MSGNSSVPFTPKANDQINTEWSWANCPNETDWLQGRQGLVIICPQSWPRAAATTQQSTAADVGIQRGPWAHVARAPLGFAG